MRAFDVAGRNKHGGRSEFNFVEAHTRERRQQGVGIAAGCVVVGITVLLILYSQGYMFREGTLQGMCNNPVVTGSEGSPLEGGELVAVVIATRHGDRTPWASEILDHPTQISCKLEGELGDAFNENKRISVVRPSIHNPARAGGDKLDRSLLPAKDDETGHCLPGELTPLGIDQMFSLGQQLHSSYHTLLEKMPYWHLFPTALPSPVVAFSTDSQRTIGSAAAFLEAFLPKEDFKSPIDIIVEPDRKKTIWRQYRRCERTDELFSKQLEHVNRVYGPKSKALQRTVGKHWDELHHITNFADPMWVHYCHGFQLPFSKETAEQISSEAQNEMCALFTGPEGGREANALAWYPILNDVVMGQLRKASNLEENYKTVTLLSLHGHYILGMMTTLGIFDKPEKCEFPAFASRLVFELWKKGDEFFVRIYYHGKLIRGFVGDKDNSGLAKLEDFNDGLKSILHGKTWEQACEEPLDGDAPPTLVRGMSDV